MTAPDRPVERPADRDVLIPSRGFADGRPTVHKFVRRERVDPTKLVGAWSGLVGHALIYQCALTGVERRYGIE